MARLESPGTGEPDRSQHKRFGDLAAAWSMLERPRARRMLTDMTPTQQRLFDLFDLDGYAPQR